MKLSKKVLLSAAAMTGLAVLGQKAASADTVTVKAGDTVYKIAQKHNTTVSAIEKANNLSNVDLIYVGQKLSVGSSSSSASTTSTASTTSQSSSSSTTTSSSSTSSTSSSSTSSAEAAAKAWIASVESGGSYTASNGNYYGKYQLSKSYLHGDYSAANQEKVANAYVASRYGSWVKAKAFWQANGWY